MTTENLESECHGIGGGAFRVALDFMPIAQSGNFIGVKPDGGTAGHSVQLESCRCQLTLNGYEAELSQFAPNIQIPTSYC